MTWDVYGVMGAGYEASSSKGHVLRSTSPVWLMIKVTAVSLWDRFR